MHRTSRKEEKKEVRKRKEGKEERRPLQVSAENVVSSRCDDHLCLEVPRRDAPLKGRLRNFRGPPQVSREGVANSGGTLSEHGQSRWCAGSTP